MMLKRLPVVARELGLDLNTVSIDVVEDESGFVLASTYRDGNRFRIVINTNGLSGLGFLLMKLGMRVRIEEIVDSVLYHELQHIVDMVEGLYDSTMTVPEFYKENELLLSMTMLVNDMARDLVMYRRLAEKIGRRRVAELEFYEPFRHLINYSGLLVYLTPLIEEKISYLHTVLHIATLEKALGLSYTIPSHGQIVELIDHAWRYGEWRRVSTHLALLGGLMSFLDIDYLCTGVLVKVLPDLMIVNVAERMKDLYELDPEYVDRIMKFFVSIPTTGERLGVPLPA